MDKQLLDLPDEILTMIFLFITDTETYKCVRSTCRKFSYILGDVKVFNNKRVDLVFKIDKNVIRIIDSSNIDVGYIRNEYPLILHYYLKRNNKIIEQSFYPNEIVKRVTNEQNNIRTVKIDKYNIRTKSNLTSTLTKFLPNNYPQNPNIHPHQLPFVANHNGCVIS